MPLLSLSTDLLKPRTSRLRWATFGLSVLLHMGFAGSAMWLDLLVQLHEESIVSSHYQLSMLPKPRVHERKVLWHDFRKSVPEVAPERPFGASKPAQGEKDASGRTLIAQSAKPASSRQVIWQPKHPEPIPADISAPNVAALPAEATPVPRPRLKQFAPPPAERAKASATPMVEPPAPVQSSATDLRGERLLHELAMQRLESAKKPPLKQFAAPPSQPNTGSGPTRLLEPPPVPAQSGSAGSLQAVIVGLDPADRFSAPIPEGSRSGQFARAPAAGSASSGASSSPNAPRVPGVTAHAPGGHPAESMAAQPGGAIPERRNVREILFPPMNRTMSAPLHASSRVVPATVEARFGNRDVFAFVIPGPKLVGYAGDWVLWFAAHQTGNGAGERIQAPIPVRKEDWSGDNGASLDSNGKGSIQFQAVIDAKGRVLSPQIVRGPISEAFRRRAIAELRTWEFKPPLRNGEAIDVDVILEIPFEFRAPATPTR